MGSTLLTIRQLSPDASGGNSASSGASGVSASGGMGSGSEAPSASVALSPGGAKDVAPPASRREKAPEQSNSKQASDKSSSPPAKSLKEQFQEIYERRRATEQTEAVKKAKEAGKKEALEEVQKFAKETPEPGEESEEKSKKDAKPKFEPNFKFKASGKEHEMEELFRSIIKDEETEKRVRELHEKAFGLEAVKSRYAELEAKYGQVQENLTPVFQKLQEADEALARNDMDALFSVLNIPQEKLLQWVISKAQLAEMDPEARRVYDERQRARQEAHAAEKRTRELQAQQFQTASAMKRREFELLMKIPEFSEYAKAFDGTRGENAFMAAVGDRGELAYLRGKDASVEEVVREVMTLYGSQGHQKAPDAAGPDRGKLGASSGNRNEPPIIPNVEGQAESAAGQAPKIKNVADIKKRYRELVAQERV